MEYVFFLLFLIPIATCVPFSGGLSILSPNEFAANYLSSSLDEVTKEYNITALLALSPATCVRPNQEWIESITQTNESLIVIIQMGMTDGCSPRQINKLYIDIPNVVGIVRIITGGSVGNGYPVVLVEKNPDPTLLPMIEIARYPIRNVLSALKRGETVIGHLTRPTTNPYWEVIYGSGRAVTVIWTIWGAMTMFIAAYKLRSYIRSVGFNPKSLPQLAMMLEIVASVMRILAVADFGAKNVFNVQTVLAFLFTHQFIVNTNSLVTAFHWQKALKRAGASICNGCNLRVPSVVVFVAWSCIFLFSIALLYENVLAAFLCFALLVITSEVVCIFFIYTGLRVIAIVSGNNSIRASKKSSVSRMAYLILISAICLMINLAGIIFTLTSVNQRNPEISLVINQLIFFPMCVTSLALMLVFSVPNAPNSDSDPTPPARSVHISMSSMHSTAQLVEEKV